MAESSQQQPRSDGRGTTLAGQYARLYNKKPGLIMGAT